MAFKSELLKRSLPIPLNIIGHDYWIGAIASKFYKFYYEITPLIKSRWYSDSVSAKKKTSLFYKLKFRMVLFYELLKMNKKILGY